MKNKRNQKDKRARHEETLEQSAGWQHGKSRARVRTKTLYTAKLTRGSGTGEVSEEGRGQVRWVRREEDRWGDEGHTHRRKLKSKKLNNKTQDHDILLWAWGLCSNSRNQLAEVINPCCKNTPSHVTRRRRSAVRCWCARCRVIAVVANDPNHPQVVFCFFYLKYQSPPLI